MSLVFTGAHEGRRPEGASNGGSMSNTVDAVADITF